MTKAWSWGKESGLCSAGVTRRRSGIIFIRQSSCCFNEFIGSSVHDPKTCGNNQSALSYQVLSRGE